MFSGVYSKKNVLITGHNGFKGSWLCFWLSRLNANITGVSLPPEYAKNHFEMLGSRIKTHYQDIRELDKLKDVFQKTSPEIVFHLAAQALVRPSYENPVETWSTNVLGTVNVLEACRCTNSVKAVVVVTSDKCYENREWERGYVENDRLGGHDPYSASKAGTELVVSNYQKSFFNKPDSPCLASVRAGNVIGGGDWAKDRLVPDIVRSIISGKSLTIRSPKAIRPWQHVIEPLSGYLLLGKKLIQGERKYAGAWNFGPNEQGCQTVEWILKKTKQYWPNFNWHYSGKENVHEASILKLDISKAKVLLGWRPIYSLEHTLYETLEWYRRFYESGDVLTYQQLGDYTSIAQKQNII